MSKAVVIRRVEAKVLAVLGGLCLTLAACGSQLPHSKIVAAANGLQASGESALGGESGSSGQDLTGTAGGVLGGSTGGSAGQSGLAGQAGGSAAGGTAGSSSSGAGARGGGAVAGGAPIVLGNIGEYSGVVGSIFPGGSAPIQAWAQLVNSRGGINGHSVKVIAADDASDPARGLSLAKQMVESQSAIAFVGSMLPLSLPGIRPYLDQKGIPLVGGDVTLPDWIQDPLIFPQGTDVTSISVASVQLITAGGINKLAVLYCGESPSCKRLADGAESHPPPGVQVVYTAQISIAQSDFTTECLQSKSDGAQAIFVAADANTVIRVGRSCSQQQYKPRYSTASIAVGPQLASDPNMNGLVAPINNAPWFITSSPATREFADAMRTYAPGVVLSAPVASMFLSGKLIEKAASYFGARPTSQELIRGLDSLRNETLGGAAPPLSFYPGRGTGPIPCYFVVAVQNNQWVSPNGGNAACGGANF